MLTLPFEPPIQPLQDTVFQVQGVEVFMKRDDLIHPFVSGNKWRKLKYVLEDAHAKGRKHLVSFGGAYSNHLVALACAGAMYGFKTTAFIRGEHVMNHMLFLCKTWGMELQFVSREDYKHKVELYNQYFSSNDQAYFIDEGGRGDLAAKGCEEMLTTSMDFTHVVCAVGTGTTLAGIARKANPLHIKAEGICVLKGAQEIDEEIKLMANGSVKVHHQFSRGGYAKTDPELMSFIQTFATQKGILLDQVYTGKMMMAVMELVQCGYYQKGDKLLLIHTGGLLGLLTQANL